MPGRENMCSNAQYTVVALGRSMSFCVRVQVLDRQAVLHDFERGGSRPKPTPIHHRRCLRQP